MWKFIYDLIVSILGGVIAGIALTWILKPELRQLLNKDSLRRIFRKEVLVAVLVFCFLGGYIFLVKKGIIPPYEFKDYLTLYDEQGNEYLVDSLHPERGKIFYWSKDVISESWSNDVLSGRGNSGRMGFPRKPNNKKRYCV